MIPFLTIDQIIERALILVANDERFKNTGFVDTTGKPILITRLRNFDGFDENSTGLTLSIYPYSYQGTSNETVNSRNAALVYEDLELGTGASRARERCVVSLVVSLQTLGFRHERKQTETETNGLITFERSEKERALYKWLTIIWDILLTNPTANLGGLVHSSKVNWGTFHTTAWEKKENAVLHKATMLWSLDTYTLRNYTRHVNVSTIPEIGPVLSWTYVGVRRKDGSPVYWDSDQNLLVTKGGLPLTVTPKGQPVTWNPTLERFENSTTNVALTPVELEDPTFSPLGPWIDTNLLLVGVLMPSRENLYWHKLLLRLQQHNGTVITALADGTPIRYDPTTNTVVNDLTGQPIGSSTDNGFLSVKYGKVSIFDANNLNLRDEFLF